jgi:putative glutamine amidotransferase
MAERPVIGIVGHGYVVPKFFGDLPVTGTPDRYVAHLAAAGGRPVVLPGAHAVDLLDRVDALVLTGGGDVEPARYGGAAEGSVDVDRARDDAEIALVRAAERSGTPVLGVCRGLQVLVVAFGGTLRTDLGMSHVLPGGGHVVSTQPGSLIRDLLGPRPEVTALHHQAVADPGPCWRSTASAEDLVVEAVEWAGAWPVLGVQWHPELEEARGAVLFEWLVGAAAIRARARDGHALAGARTESRPRSAVGVMARHGCFGFRELVG